MRVDGIRGTKQPGQRIGRQGLAGFQVGDQRRVAGRGLKRAGRRPQLQRRRERLHRPVRHRHLPLPLALANDPQGLGVLKMDAPI
ncbi:hypothetical protein R69608_06286 [Paraburkholderia nemoris]|uniref:Uncharacterized protein n=1 Tax=Paraburkholderia nemoris TaxID=2793076 RepID=A0ABM8T256_9BURK|nr:hypothetical protein R69619_06400 [Paraburkholderia nemoris]CAE6842385.1 hypothetical protein R75777_07135 [Paraburkholderia nemoris]CAE6851371.1 hypothetical protein R69776_07519 [Paraburkholderia nemoris]CAE6859729.1 hypothetical protein R69749_05374 [Paraburkholderia domus]CAE6958308.1 hypothetical protein R69608_06286 [Paraburkholderia nemoris]